jgi:L-seryl-tRNA(Ser) seleniumtransferase
MAPEVLDAMRAAAASFVHLDELQERAGAIIAEHTGAEAGYVVSGAASGLALGAAACIAGMNVVAMDQLPDVTGLKHEIVVQRGHRNAYDHAIRMTGARFVEVGYLGYPGAGGTMPWQLEAAITEHTAAVACPILDTPGTLTLPEVAKIAHARGVPVIVDAAAALPPRTNLKRFIAEGADLVVFSGGKAIGGPQSSGILAGRQELIDSVAMQHLDMDVRVPTWNRRHLLETGHIRGIPHQGFGRAMKVGREEIVGLLVALERFAAGSDEEDFAAGLVRLATVQEQLGTLPGVTIELHQAVRQAIPQLWLHLDELALGFSAYDVVNRLLHGDPAVAISESRAEHGTLIVNPASLSDDEAASVGKALRHVLGTA